MPKSFKILQQLGIILLITFCGEVIQRLTNIPIPGSILGMVILLILLKTKVIKLEQISAVADFFLENITFFFLPVGVSIMASYHFLKGYYVEGFLLIFITTVIVMIISGVVAEILARRRDRRIENKNNE